MAREGPDFGATAAGGAGATDCAASDEPPISTSTSMVAR